MNVLLGVTGSVAAIKTPQLVRALLDTGHAVRVVATKASTYFFDPAALSPTHVSRDEDEWPGQRYERDAPVLHIELRRWADLFLIAPLDANTLAKLANGLADNCLTCVWRAWDTDRPAVLAPAMNTLMWQHPLTARHLRRLAEDAGLSPPALGEDDLAEWIDAHAARLRIVAPESRRLACGDVGVGAMASVERIVEAVERLAR
jgi:phosphopantothenoylcysteine decarboxylase